MERLLRTDQALLRALNQLREHQRQQQRLARLKDEVAKKDGVVEQLALQLQQAQGTLQRVIDDTTTKLDRPLVPGGGSARRDGVDVDEVVAYAHKVSYTTSAPPNWNPNLPHMRMFLPPAPQEINILQGNFYHNSTSAPIPDFSDLTGAAKKAEPDLGAPDLGAGPTLPMQQPLPFAGGPAPALIPIAELPPAPPSGLAPPPSEPVKQIMLDLNPDDEDSDSSSDLDDDEDDWV